MAKQINKSKDCCKKPFVKSVIADNNTHPDTNYWLIDNSGNRFLTENTDKFLIK